MIYKTRKIYWTEDSKIPGIMDKPFSELSNEELKLLVLELDRRLIQFWDKVHFENRINNGT